MSWTYPWMAAAVGGVVVPHPARRRSYLRRGLAIFAAVSAVVAAAPPAHAAVQLDVVYVSPTGDDSHSGHSWQQPVRTLEHARDLVRDLLPDATGDVTVRL